MYLYSLVHQKQFSNTRKQLKRTIFEHHKKNAQTIITVQFLLKSSPTKKKMPQNNDGKTP